MEDIFNELVKGNIKLYQLDALIWEKIYKKDSEKWSQATKDASLLRLRFLEKKLNKKFENIRRCYVDTSGFKKSPTTGIEQKIGSAAVPLGVAGPLKVNGEYAKGEFYIPLATNEAALVAGLNRGCSVVNKVDGVKTIVTRDWMTRSPLIEAPDIKTASNIAKEVKNKGKLFEKMKVAAEKESRVSKLIDIQPFQIGKSIHLRFLFQTGDSMGMNSATKYSANAIKVLLKEFPSLKLVTLSSNMCADKKASHVNVLLGRGKSVETEVKIPLNIIKNVFEVEPENMLKINFLKNYQGSALSGTLTGFNLNAANTIAAMFIATGQDAAQIVESSTCFTHAEIQGNYFVFGVTLPCLEIATTGGGTNFGTAKECLEMLGCYGPGKQPGDNAKKLAEIIAAAVTCQELNLLGTQAHDYELAESHIRLARGQDKST